MRQTLFFIPHELAGIPVFGFGWLLSVAVVICIAVLAYLVKTQGWNDEAKSFLGFCALVGALIAFVLPAVEVAVVGHEVEFMAWNYPTEPGVPKMGLPIRGYGVFLLVATVSGVLLARYRAIQVGLSPDAIYNLAFYMFVGGILGARLFFVIQYWSDIHDPTSIANTLKNIVNFVEGGLVVYGSLIGALVAAVIFLRRNAIPILPVADLISPSLALGLAIGRIGCLMNGCCFGGVCDHSWAIEFPSHSPVFFHQHSHGTFYGFTIREGDDGKPRVGAVRPNSAAAKQGLQPGEQVQAVNGIRTDNMEQAEYALLHSDVSMELQTTTNHYQLEIPALPEKAYPVHPTQLYSSLNALLIAGLAYALFPFRRQDGDVFSILILCYAITRFLLEIIRTDEGGFAQTGLTISQNVSIGMLIFFVLLRIYVSSRPRATFWPQPVLN